VDDGKSNPCSETRAMPTPTSRNGSVKIQRTLRTACRSTQIMLRIESLLLSPLRGVRTSGITTRWDNPEACASAFVEDSRA
jgi:hypothetical protein